MHITVYLTIDDPLEQLLLLFCEILGVHILVFGGYETLHRVISIGLIAVDKAQDLHFVFVLELFVVSLLEGVTSLLGRRVILIPYVLECRRLLRGTIVVSIS